MPSESEQVALRFARALAARDYPAAYLVTSVGYQQRTAEEELREQFEDIVPTDWGSVDPIEVGQTMDSWPGKQPSDVAWVYVSLGGDVYSEALTLVVTQESGELKIRAVEFGRP